MILILPIIVSSAFVPTQTMPGWLRVFADNQPMTQAIDSIRALLLGQPVGNHVWLTLMWFTVIIIVMYTAASLIFKRRTSN
jgi:ABC-2 type transport system permease protein